MSERIPSLARCSVAIAFAACMLGADTTPPVAIQLEILEGAGAIYIVGSRATRAVAVRVTDESGKPVEGAIVTFQLPADGPSGSFLSGSKTEVAMTKVDGIANIWGMQWNDNPGTCNIKVTASIGQAQANLAIPQHITDKTASGRERTLMDSHYGHMKWVVLIGAIAAGAGAGIAMIGSGSKTSPTAPPTQTPIQIGTPTIIVGNP